jgi:transcriptional regulator with XRE-family HTH domain
MNNIGHRLKEVRTEQGLSLRALARLANVSPSFLSQIENGKSQPSVATLFSISKLLGVEVQELFGTSEDGNDATEQSSAGSEKDDVNGFSNPAQAWGTSEYTNRISLIHPSHRASLEMAEGVRWQRLAATPEKSVNFMMLSYAPGSSSTIDDSMQVHEGYEYGYLLEGELEMTVGSEVFVLQAGQSIGFDSSIPHIFRNRGETFSRPACGSSTARAIRTTATEKAVGFKGESVAITLANS